MSEIIEYDLVLGENCRNELREKKRHKYRFEKLNSSRVLVDCFNKLFHLNEMAEEYICILGLNFDNVVVGAFEISHGTKDESLFSIRSILTRILLCGADRLVICHNHSSQRLQPSEEDKQTTADLKEACELLGIELWDDLIVTKESYYSTKDNEW